MNYWHRMELNESTESLAKSEEIENVFWPTFMAAGGPVGMAVFSGNNLDDHVLTYYFSPDASKIARIFHATPCGKPTEYDGLGLLFGDQRAIKLFFPELGS